MLESFEDGQPKRRDVLQLAGMLGVSLMIPGCMPIKPDFSLSESEVAFMSELAEVIIPTTDTPGAGQASVGEFARMMVADWFDEQERERFVTGLGICKADLRSRFGREFADLSTAEKKEAVASILTPAEKRLANAPKEALKGSPASPTGSLAPPTAVRTPFIIVMKRLTVLGYYTSEIGASQELELNLVPGHYDSCAHEDPGMRAGSILGLRAPTFSAN
jgi:hypothetical protein